jgi:hypothetical protein
MRRAGYDIGTSKDAREQSGSKKKGAINPGINHRNRKGILYHLGQATTKTGKPRYFFSPRVPQEPVLRIPAGFEISESVNGVVSLRKEVLQPIDPEELRLVQAEIDRHDRLKGHRADSSGKAVTVYEPFGFFSGVFTQSIANHAANSPRPNCAIQAVESRCRYTPVMRFVLVDRNLREFEAQRMCYRSSIDGWLALDRGSLRDMARKYIPHIGRESFFELFAW